MDGDRRGGARDEDEAIGHWLGRLRDGGPDEQANARTELGLILERRGMLDDAIEAYRRNVDDGVRDRRPYDRLAAIYRERGDAAAEAAVMDAFADALRGTDTPTMVGLPILTPSAPPLMPPAPPPPPPVAGSPEDDVPADLRPYPRPAGRSAPDVRPRQRPIGRPIASSGRQGSGMSPGLGILIALLGLLALIGSIIFAMLWSDGRLGALNLGASLGQVGGQAGAGADPSSSSTPATAAGSAAALASAPAASPSPAPPPPPECWNAAVRFPESQQPEEAVRRALLEHLVRQDGAADPDSPQVRSQLDAHVARADDLVAGWMGVSLQRAQRRLQTFSLTAYVGSELLIPNDVGQAVLRPTISEQGWREMQAWPTETCEGAFMARSENARWVGSMRVNVGDISWALTTASPVPSPSPSPAPR